MSINVKMNGTTHELQEKSRMTFLGTTANTVYTWFNFPDSTNIRDYEYFIVCACQGGPNNDYKERPLATTYIPVTDTWPIADGDTTKNMIAVYPNETSTFEACVAFKDTSFALKSKNSIWCVTKLFGKLLGGGFLNLRTLIGGFAYEL